MTLSNYNNQILLSLDNTKPLNDDSAKERDNSLRSLVKSSGVNKWYECKNACLNNPDCVTYKYDEDNTICELFRKEPYKETKDLALNNCIEFCSRDNECDYLSHSKNNKCSMYTRESLNEQSKTAINDLWFDFSIYGQNSDKGVYCDNFDECRKKIGHDHFVYYNDSKYAISKRFYEDSAGNTTVYFNKQPYDKYDSLNKYIGLKSSVREQIEYYKIYIVIVWILILICFFNWVVKM